MMKLFNRHCYLGSYGDIRIFKECSVDILRLRGFVIEKIIGRDTFPEKIHISKKGTHLRHSNFRDRISARRGSIALIKKLCPRADHRKGHILDMYNPVTRRMCGEATSFPSRKDVREVHSLNILDMVYSCPIDLS